MTAASERTPIVDEEQDRCRSCGIAFVPVAIATKLELDRQRLIECLRELTLRCDGEEGVRADRSNIQTIAAHAILREMEGE